jgi:predicted nuclease of predicted toxin-antitoxin system
LKVLLDSCIWSGARDSIAAAGHEVEWVGAWAGDPGDEEILAHAFANRQVVVTLDKDFGELAVAFGRAHAGIVRLVDVRHTEQATLCVELLSRHGADLSRGAIVTADPGRVRIRSADTEGREPG